MDMAIFPFPLGTRVQKSGSDRVAVVRSYVWGGTPGDRVLLMIVGHEPDGDHEFPIGFKIPAESFGEWSEVGS